MDLHSARKLTSSEHPLPGLVCIVLRSEIKLTLSQIPASQDHQGGSRRRDRKLQEHELVAVTPTTNARRDECDFNDEIPSFVCFASPSPIDFVQALDSEPFLVPTPLPIHHIACVGVGSRYAHRGFTFPLLNRRTKSESALSKCSSRFTRYHAGIPISPPLF